MTMTLGFRFRLQLRLSVSVWTETLVPRPPSSAFASVSESMSVFVSLSVSSCHHFSKEREREWQRHHRRLSSAGPPFLKCAGYRCRHRTWFTIRPGQIYSIYICGYTIGKILENTKSSDGNSDYHWTVH
ncbi:uncharacterized protein LOC120456014 [Drosophila santomea]|uniref:uncharacterized protein LOC120456014 n=1 Tax=Drosophila santomea TaxID=129105 RepID=UPI0019548899|nr:uncharacterized protein LOC120456014 [Drosophila santomea]